MDNENMKSKQGKTMLGEHTTSLLKEVVNNRNLLNEQAKWIQDHYVLHDLLNNVIENETKINENNVTLICGLEKKISSLKKLNHLMMAILIIHIVFTCILFVMLKME